MIEVLRDDRRVMLSDMPAEQYHGVESLSSGGIKRLLQSPHHFRYWKDNPPPPSDAMRFGTAVHTAILEPDRLLNSIACVPGDAPDRRSNAGKEWWRQFEAAAAGKIVLTNEQVTAMTGMRDAVFRCEVAVALLDEPERWIEPSLLWKDARYGVKCKMRPDFLAKDCGYIIDLKTTVNASREHFARSCWNYRYDIQAAFYIDGATHVLDIMPRAFVWIAVESAPPHAVAVYRASGRMIRRAQIDIERGLELYQRCVSEGAWPGYRDEVTELDLPRYAYRVDQLY